MKLATGAFWMGMLAIAGCSTTPGEAQTPAVSPVATAIETATPSAVTIWDGVYTAAQANRGEELSRSNCFSCHGPRDWANPVMIPTWSGRPITELYEQIRATMPYDSPGRLSRQEYADILSFILELNGAPPGDTPLPADQAAQQQIQVTRPPTP